jgi:3,4-dihydroxy-2-butanone 4-phosphate synthase
MSSQRRSAVDLFVSPEVSCVSGGDKRRLVAQAVKFAEIEHSLRELRSGRMIVIVDDEDPENEGDLMIAAEMVTPEVINFMATYSRGLICLDTRSNFGCNAAGMSPASSKNKVPLSAISKRPIFSAIAPVKAPFS